LNLTSFGNAARQVRGRPTALPARRRGSWTVDLRIHRRDPICDDEFPNRTRHEKRFAETIDTIAEIVGDDLPSLRFRATKLFYPLFCAVYHLKYGLPRMQAPRRSPKPADYPRMKDALEQIDTLIGDIESGATQPSDQERKLFEAQKEHWVHASNRITLAQQLCRRLMSAQK